MDYIFIMYLVASLILILLGLFVKMLVYKETSKYRQCRVKTNGVIDEIRRVTTIAVGGSEIAYIKHIIVRFSNKNGEMCAAMCDGGPGMSKLKVGDRVTVKYNINDTENAYVYVYSVHVAISRLLIAAGTIVMLLSIYGLRV